MASSTRRGRLAAAKVGFPGALRVPLFPDVDASVLLTETLRTLNAACNWLAARAFETKCADPDILHQRYYREIKGRFGVQSQFAIQVIAKVAWAYGRDLTIQPTFRSDGAFPYVHIHLWTCPKTRPGVVSLATLKGRRDVRYGVPERFRELFDAACAKGTEAGLQYHRGRWWLVPVVRHPQPAPIVATGGTLGVDLGIVNLAVDSDNETHSGSGVEAVRLRHEARRRDLQREKSARSHANRAAAKKHGVRVIPKKTRALRRKVGKVGQKEALYRRDTNHCISKKIVAKAVATHRRIALEDLTGILDDVQSRKAQRARLHGWAFAQLRFYITYKAARAGVPVVVVPARGTSTTCLNAACRYRSPKNRATRDTFACVRCGSTAPADWVGACNVVIAADVMQPQSSGHNPHDTGATSASEPCAHRGRLRAISARRACDALGQTETTPTWGK